MSTKTIIDYIVVKGDDTSATFLERGNARIKELEKSLKPVKAVFEQNKMTLESYESLKNEFEKYINFNVGDTYSAVPELSIHNWKGGLKHMHPTLLESASNSTDVKVTLATKEKVKQSYEAMLNKIQDCKVKFNGYQKDIDANQKELEQLKSNSNPTLNKATRTKFESDVQELLNMGYVLQGGVDARHGNLYQAMVKYDLA